MSAVISVVPWPREVSLTEGTFDFRSLRLAEMDASLPIARFNRFVQNVGRRFGSSVALFRDAGGSNLRFGRQSGGGESYQIEISSALLEIRASNAAGFGHALETLLQLMDAGADTLTIPCTSIRDSPRFPWRGLLLDPVRHWLPVSVIKKTLEGMAAVKLNVLHWHLTDDQAFRIECRSFPRLHEVASRGEFYTVQDVAEVVGFAGTLGIRVVPEFDVPGHATSWVAAYPHLGCTDQTPPLQDRWGIFDTLLNPARESTYAFLDTFFAEMAGRFPDEYLHIGGDEVNGREWLESAEITAHMDETGISSAAELQAQFMERVSAIVRKHRKRPVAWEEGSSSVAIAQTYKSAEAAVAPRAPGSQVIVSFGFYLDLMRSVEEHYAVRLPDVAEGDSENVVAGGEACLWSEFVTEENITSRLWPRLGAIAERLWSQTGGEHEPSLYQRLDSLQARLLSLGVDASRDATDLFDRMVPAELLPPLLFIAGGFEPVKDYVRHLSGNYDIHTPLNRLVDVIPAESRIAREVDQATSAEEMSGVVAILDRILEDGALVERGIPGTHFEEILPAVQRLMQNAKTCRDALLAVLGHGIPSNAAVEELDELLPETTAPVAELVVPLAAAVHRLLKRLR
jgi:hexosaminidase